MIVYSREELAEICTTLRREGKRIITTNGCFDLLHRGHVEFLTKAKALGDVLVVGVNTDDSIKRLKGPSRPINRLEDRLAVLDALRPVDIVHPFSELLPNAFLEAVKPHIHVKGGDYKAENLPEREVVEKYKGRVEIIPLSPGYSTTRLIETILRVYGKR